MPFLPSTASRAASTRICGVICSISTDPRTLESVGRSHWWPRPSVPSVVCRHAATLLPRCKWQHCPARGASSSRNVAGVSITAAFLLVYFLFTLFGSAGLCAWPAGLSIHFVKLFVSRCNTREVIFIPRCAAISAAARHNSSGSRVPAAGLHFETLPSANEALLNPGIRCLGLNASWAALSSPSADASRSLPPQSGTLAERTRLFHTEKALRRCAPI